MTSKSANEEDTRQQPTANPNSQETSVHHAAQEKDNYCLSLIASLALQYFLNTDGKREKEEQPFQDALGTLRNTAVAFWGLGAWLDPLSQVLSGSVEIKVVAVSLNTLVGLPSVSKGRNLSE